jgi:hypothetical protein
MSKTPVCLLVRPALIALLWTGCGKKETSSVHGGASASVYGFQTWFQDESQLIVESIIPDSVEMACATNDKKLTDPRCFFIWRSGKVSSGFQGARL